MYLSRFLFAFGLIACCSAVGFATDDAGDTAKAGAVNAAPPPPQPPQVDLAKQPTLYVVGYAHLDTEWRWMYPQTIREFIPNTMRNNFALFDKYPGYVFNFSGSRRYQFMQEYYPEDYARLKQYVAQGRWFPCGSSVDENDANVPSAESFVRHVLYGNRFFRREFGVASEEFMLPDCFGFPAALPTLLAHCGIKGFSTQKLTWGSAVGIPFKVGLWEGPDGRGVVAALDPGAYVGEVKEDLSAAEGWLTRIKNTGAISGMFADYHYYGTGDQGGAPTEESVRMVEKSIAGTGPIKVVSGPSDWLFKTITPEMRERLPKYKGELLLTEHSAGSITSEAFMKRCNRKNELLAQGAELAAVSAEWLGGAAYPAKTLEDAWTLVLGSQMHDILPGTSHPKAYEYAWNDELLAANMFAEVETDSVGVIASAMDTRVKGTPLIVYNPLAMEREDIVEASLPGSREQGTSVAVFGPDGQVVPSQSLGFADGKVKFAFVARVPSAGCAVFDVRLGLAGPLIETGLSVDQSHVENGRYRVSLDANGDVGSIFDKTANREMLSDPARLALLYERPRSWPAWNMDWADRQNPPKSFVGDGSWAASVRIVEYGPARVALEVSREHEGSRFVQRIRLGAGAGGDRVEFDTAIDWVTRERSLKASFPMSVSNPKATYDIQAGAIERDNNNPKRYENPSHQWFDLTDASGGYGVSIVNDCKYGSDKPDDRTLRLTLVYTPGVRGVYQDQGTQDLGHHEMLYAVAGHEGDWRKGGTPGIAARVNQPLRAFACGPHEGALGKQFSLLVPSTAQVAITAIKKAEEGEGVVVRVRELYGQEAKNVRVAFGGGLLGAEEVDGQERPIGPARVAADALVVDLGPFDLRAYRVQLARSATRAWTVKSRPIDLPFDADVTSSDAARADGAMDSAGHSYPAEQWPRELTHCGVPFTLGPTGAGKANALACRGQEMDLPDAGFKELHLLAAAAEADTPVSFDAGGHPVQITIERWRGYVGSWDNRRWRGEVPEQAHAWSNALAGLDPGYVKRDAVAWFATHHHSPSGDEHYQYCYLFHYRIALPPGTSSIRLPSNDQVRIFAMTGVKSGHERVEPAAPLYDTLGDRGQDAPRVVPAGGKYGDSTEVRVEPGLYSREGSIRYTLDGSEPTPVSPAYAGPVRLNASAVVKAAVVDPVGRMGPAASASFSIDDRTAPKVVEAAATFQSPVVRLRFSEPVDGSTLKGAGSVTLDPPIAIASITLDDAGMAADIVLGAAVETGQPYTLRLRGLKDRSPNGNSLAEQTIPVVARGPVYIIRSVRPEQMGTALRGVEGLPVRGRQPWTINMFVRTDKQPDNRTVIAGFGKCDGAGDGCARYICKFAGGVHFWSHHCDAESHAPLELGKWQMLSATYDGRTVRLYKDALQVGESTVELADDEAVIWFAPPDPWEHTLRFDGQISEFTIWDSCLGPDSLARLKH